MDFDHENVRSAINEDRLSSLPDELIHQILSCIDSKFAVQTCLLSSRWKLLWTSMPCLNFASHHFVSLHKFAKFVTHVLSHRNHQIEVTSVKLDFHGAASQFFVRKIANYVFSHNVQELTVVILPKEHHEFPPCLFNSQSLKHFTLSSYFFAPCVTPKTPWDFPALTSLHLNEVALCEDNTYKSVDLFSKKLKFINLVAPQLENLTVIDCSIKNPIAPPGLSTLSYRGFPPPQLSKEGFHSLNKVTISLSIYSSNMPFKEKDARKTINLLQEVHSARFLTLNFDIVECISSFPDLISHRPSPFSNLICLDIDSDMRNDAYKVNMSTEARNFLLENSPNATFIMELPEAPPTKAMKQKEARAKRKAKLVADIERHMTELQALVELGKMHHGTTEGVKDEFGSLIAESRMLIEQKMMLNEQVKESAERHKAEMQIQVDQRTVQTESGRPQIELGKVLVEEGMQMQVEPRELPIDSHNAEMQLKGREAHTESEGVCAGLFARFEACVPGIRYLVNKGKEDGFSIFKKMDLIRSLLEKLPKRQRAEIEAHYSRQLEASEAQGHLLITDYVAYEKFLSDEISTFQNAFSSNIRQASESSSSCSPIIYLLTTQQFLRISHLVPMRLEPEKANSPLTSSKSWLIHWRDHWCHRRSAAVGRPVKQICHFPKRMWVLVLGFQIDNRINRRASVSYFRRRFKGRAEREGMMVIWQKTQKKQI
ncbi:hypothetical protein L6452_16864 [Arctium lappa]|uniref:Uncharacterized protein n=1 Tax=Arctium lappa TaxID=4217 RepID=A0ACB9C1T5_ARCLA|nr:hypothetical protein L6452_16864 [Arctium lappa]